MNSANTSQRGSRPKLAYVVHSLEPGGTERLVVDMSLAFLAENDVFVYCLDLPGRWAETLRSKGIPVRCLWRQPGIDFSVAFRLAAFFRSDEINIVHAHQCTPWFYAALARHLCSSPRLILEEHGRFYPEQDKPVRRLVNRYVIANRTDRFIAVSNDIRDRLVRYEGLQRESIEVIYNGVTRADALPEGERDRLRDECGFSPGDFVVGTVGRLDPIKNLPMLIDAFAKCIAKFPRLKGLIIGDGEEADTIRNIIEVKNLSNSIKLTGFRSDSRQLTASLDVFVLSSLSEGTSMALLEAIAAGVPVIVTDVGGNPEIVEDTSSGRVVPSGDVEALAEAISETILRPQVAEEMAEVALEKFDESFSFDAMVDRYRNIYHELCPVREDLADCAR